jgi:hypothetical protein
MNSDYALSRLAELRNPKGSAALKGLIIRDPWIGKILAGKKTWELRSRHCNHRGELALVRQGTGLVVGMARLIDNLHPLDEHTMRQTMEFHGVPEDRIPEVIERNWCIPWVLTHVQPLARPVPFDQKPGAVTFAKIDAKAEDEIRKQQKISNPS